MKKKEKDVDLDPLGSYKFRVEIDGIEVFGFQEVSGLSNKTEIYTFEEGGQNKYTHKLVGKTTFSNLILKKGMVIDQSIYEWREQVIDGNIEEALRDITITLIANDSWFEGIDDLSWRFYDVWPCRWESSSFDSLKDAVGIETLELALTMGEEVKK